MKNRSPFLSRRAFSALFGGTAAAAALSPTFLRWLERDLASVASAQDRRGPPRFLAVRSPHGVDRDYWVPKETAGLVDPRGSDIALSDLTFEYDDAILTPLMGWRSQFTVLDGLDTQVCKEGTRADRRRFHGHQEQGSLLTGAQPPLDRESANYDNHPSLDFYLHGRFGAPALLTACVEGTGGWKAMSYDDNGRPRDPTQDPQTLFRAAFPADYDPGVPRIDTSVGERLILEHNIAQLERLRDRLGGAEQTRVAAHLAAVRRLLSTGGVGGSGACTTRGSDVPTRDGNIRSLEDVEAVTRAHAQVIAQAFACNRARVATLQILNDYPNWPTLLPEVAAAARAAGYAADYRFHENLVHDYWGAAGPTVRRGYTAGLRFFASMFAAVLEELDRVADPQDPSGGSILANTVVFWHNEFGHDGHDNQHTRHPAIVAGGGGHVLKLGRYLRLRNIASEERVPHNRLLTSLAHAMGFTDVDYYGDRDLAARAEYRGPLVPLMV